MNWFSLSQYLEASISDYKKSISNTKSKIKEWFSDPFEDRGRYISYAFTFIQIIVFIGLISASDGTSSDDDYYYGLAAMWFVGTTILRAILWLWASWNRRSPMDETEISWSKGNENLESLNENNNVVKDLRELADLKAKGLIDDEEFKSAKRKLLE